MTAPIPMSARDLLALRFNEPKWAVPGVIPEGLFLIAARPKMGKSWLMLNLSVAVAAGGPSVRSACAVATCCTSPWRTRHSDRRADQ